MTCLFTVSEAIASCVEYPSVYLSLYAINPYYSKEKLCENIFLKVLAEKVHVKALTIAQRVKLLQQGLNDRSGKMFSF